MIEKIKPGGLKVCFQNGGTGLPPDRSAHRGGLIFYWLASSFPSHAGFQRDANINPPEACSTHD